MSETKSTVLGIATHAGGVSIIIWKTSVHPACVALPLTRGESVCTSNLFFEADLNAQRGFV